MILAAIPENDEERLAALRALKILDTPAEERFDSITRFTADLFDVPISYVAMVDENRQWLKSRVGIDLCQSERTSSFCGHAIHGEEALVIPDTHQDARFHDNPLVRGTPFARFYAGQPLRSPEGQAIGTLCLMSPEPRSFAERERRLLRDLGKLVERELTLVDTVRLQTQLLETKDRLLHVESNLATELAEAARYVRKLLPEPVDSPLSIDWVFQPSLALGGDAFGYHWSDSGELGIYLLDACGHGVGPALLSVSVINLLKTQRDCALCCPSKLLGFLNRAFPMEQHHDLYFTMWLGAYEPSTNRLTFSAAGHPPAILRRAKGHTEQIGAGFGAPPVGILETDYFVESSIEIYPGDTLYVYSDGAYEVPVEGHRMMTLEAFESLIAQPRTPPSPADLLEILRSICQENGSPGFPDDLSIVRVRF